MELIINEELGKSAAYYKHSVENQRHTNKDIEGDQDGNVPAHQFAEDLELNKSLQLMPKKTFLRRGEGLKQRFKIDPNTLRLNNLPRYKYGAKRSRFLQGTNPNSTKSQEKVLDEKEDLLNTNEKLFQQLQICTSNDKLNPNPTVNNAPLPSVYASKDMGVYNRMSTNGCVPSKELNSGQLMSWAKVLDAQHIKPVAVHQIRPRHSGELHDFDENLSIFELLEQKANDGTIDMDSSCIQRLIKRSNRNYDDIDRFPINSNFQTSTFVPTASILDSVSADDTKDDEVDSSPTLAHEKGRNETKPIVQVRFADTLDSLEYTEKSDEPAIVSNLRASLDSLNMGEKPLIQRNKDQDGSPRLGLSEELQELINLVKTRLTELEKEISVFKETNISLIKAKQEHELEKSILSQERLEIMNDLNEQKIKMEICLQDELMKLENEKRKFERQMQMQKTTVTSKNRKEIVKLNQELEETRSQMKLKEQDHVAAQNRLRAQIRSLEKHQNQLYNDIERLKKENQCLQNENLKLSRGNNNKMLQEINRNIANLAPKLRPHDDACCLDGTICACKTTECKQIKSKKKFKSFSSKKPGLKSDTASYLDREEYPVKLNISISKNSDINNSTNCKDLQKSDSVPDMNTTSNGDKFKREVINPDGSKDIWYSNGNLKKVDPEGMFIRMLYFNKDIKETNISEGTVKYYYSETNTWHTTYLDGLEILEFPNGQTEHRYKNGVVEVRFPNNSIKVTNPADENIVEEWRFADGTNLKEMRNGEKIFTLPNGQKEIHTKSNKRREYPDGTVKFVYPDGSQETRYSNGRVRLRDKDGQLIMDSEDSTYA